MDKLAVIPNGPASQDSTALSQHAFVAIRLLRLCEYDAHYLNTTLMLQDITKLLQTWLDENINNVIQEYNIYETNECVLSICRVLTLRARIRNLNDCFNLYCNIVEDINEHFANIIPKQIKDAHYKELQEIFPKDISNIILSYSIKTEKFYSTLFS